MNEKPATVSVASTPDGRAQLSRYLVTGVWNTVLGYGVFVLLYAALSPRVHYLVVAVLSNVLSITNAYVVHKLFVFRTKGNYLQEYLRYYVVYGMSALSGIAALAGLVSGLGMNVYLAQLAVLGLQALVSFAGHQRFSFRPSSGHR
ncbi:MAG: GtrA family protein [Vicinamibacterales bacterium]